MSETRPGHIIPERNKENKEVGPNITVDFFFSPHGTAEDFSRLPEALKKADVYMPETAGWTEDGELLLNDISQGIIGLDELTIRNPAEEKQLSALYNLKIPVIFVDIPEGHRLLQEFLRAGTETSKAYTYFFNGEFDKAVEKAKEGMVDEVLAIKDREDFIANKLKKELKTLTQKFPQLKNKKDIRVLISLGDVHTSLHQKLKSELQLSKMILGRNTLVFGINDEIIRRLIRDPEEVISDTLYARSLMEAFISTELGNITEDTNKSNWVTRKLVSALSIDQIQSFCKKLATPPPAGTKASTEIYRLKSIQDGLEQLGIKLPATEEEIDELLKLKNK